MSRTYRNYAKVSKTCFRHPRGHKQSKVASVRRRATPPSNYDDIRYGREDYLPWRIAVKLVNAGKSFTEVVHKLHKKLKLDYNLAEGLAISAINSKALRDERERLRKERKAKCK